MTEHPLQALMKAVWNRLAAGSYIWNTRVSETPQPTWDKPYCQVYYISGTESNFLREQDAEFELGIKVIASDQAQSMAGAAQVIEALNDQGVQDLPTSALDGGTDWEISTSTQTRIIHMVEPFQNAVNIYHDGGVFSFVMGRKAT